METDYGDDSRCSSSRIDACLFWVRRCYVFPIKLYRLCLSPYFGTQCRFYPTCSAYAIEAIMTHGIFKGSALMVWRLLRCNPWSEGGYDPVPKVASGTPAPETTPAHHHCGSSTPGDNYY